MDPTLKDAISAVPYTTVCKVGRLTPSTIFLRLTAYRLGYNSGRDSGNIMSSQSSGVAPRRPTSQALERSVIQAHCSIPPVRV